MFQIIISMMKDNNFSNLKYSKLRAFSFRSRFFPNFSNQFLTYEYFSKNELNLCFLLILTPSRKYKRTWYLTFNSSSPPLSLSPQHTNYNHFSLESLISLFTSSLQTKQFRIWKKRLKFYILKISIFAKSSKFSSFITESR